MNTYKSYFKKYENNNNHYADDDINTYINDFDFIIEKKNNNNYQCETKNNMIIFQNKVEELFLKLKFLNLNNKILNIDISDYINDINNINDNLTYSDKIICVKKNKQNINSTNAIDYIEKIILSLDKKIICKGQIKRKNNLIDFEF